jgi:hypothetical protein
VAPEYAGHPAMEISDGSGDAGYPIVGDENGRLSHHTSPNANGIPARH